VTTTAVSCVLCGRTFETPFCTHCGLDAAGHFAPVAIDPEAADLEKRVNPGAALCAGLWPFSHGAAALGVLYWVSMAVLPPVPLGIMIYLFFNGNRIALQRRRYASAAQFREVERKWAVAGIGVGPLLLAIIFIAAAVLFNNVVVAQRNAYNQCMQTTADATKCSVP
jgi:hypothetical protein